MSGIAKSRGLTEGEWNELQTAARGWWPYMRRYRQIKLLLFVFSMLSLSPPLLHRAASRETLGVTLEFCGSALVVATPLILFGTWTWWMARRLARTIGLC